MARPVPQDHWTDSAEDRRDFNRRLRAAWISGAEHGTRKQLGRALTDEELRRVIAQYPDDIERA